MCPAHYISYLKTRARAGPSEARASASSYNKYLIYFKYDELFEYSQVLTSIYQSRINKKQSYVDDEGKFVSYNHMWFYFLFSWEVDFSLKQFHFSDLFKNRLHFSYWYQSIKISSIYLLFLDVKNWLRNMINKIRGQWSFWYIFTNVLIINSK